MVNKGGRGKGRASASDIAQRRMNGLAYLRRYFPIGAELWEKLRSDSVTKEDLQQGIKQIIAEASNLTVPELDDAKDSVSLNPEAFYARALARVGASAARIKGCKMALAELASDRAAMEKLLAVLESDEKKAKTDVVDALHSRPKIDREIERNARAVARGGINRANIARLKQSAHRMWAQPYDWTKLPRSGRGYGVTETPDSGGISQELLPPSQNIAAYWVDPSKRGNFSGEALLAEDEMQLTSWIAAHYPGRKGRRDEVMAAAWVKLLHLSDPAAIATLRPFTVLLPSVWKEGHVMRISG